SVNSVTAFQFCDVAITQARLMSPSSFLTFSIEQNAYQDARALKTFGNLIRRITRRASNGEILCNDALTIGQSDLEQLPVARLDLFALCQHGRRIGLQKFESRQRRATRLVLDEAVEGMMRVLIDQHLLTFQAQEVALEQSRCVGIGCVLEHAGGNDDQR